MSNSKSNFPNAVKPTTKPGEISSMVKGYETLWELPPVRKGEVELAKQRIAEYFQFCQSADRKRSVEGLALALGTSRQNLWLWEQAGDEMGEIVARAKALINAMLTDFAMNNKIPCVYGIWLQKNHFGYSETKQIEIIPPRESHKTLEQQVTESNLIWDDETGEFIPKE